MNEFCWNHTYNKYLHNRNETLRQQILVVEIGRDDVVSSVARSGENQFPFSSSSVELNRHLPPQLGLLSEH
ncbi:hypothetical protein AAHA92_07814 [Salvia divinorum]|uniref:Uncharacterized protein n=1 Tax=Salvia divinorum TaxID=28513 RepID=A0ABD1IB55_SALDI